MRRLVGLRYLQSGFAGRSNVADTIRDSPQTALRFQQRHSARHARSVASCVPDYELFNFAIVPASVAPSFSTAACFLASLSEPSALNASWALGTVTWSGNTSTLMLPRIQR